ncbi:glycolate oxidase FAD binding subunit [Rubricella aquisinus]|uniref:Glycolate oxidase FAD binding subunit n=1 Tax=Rubricella aquisinus TaxID=2028108 RepID=A0A840WJB0_9RHOB|nr:glycolate oxidase FAD binding subunit [Rubricella aquisinus]
MTLQPRSESDLSEAVASAYAAKTPLEIVGGGTRRTLGGPVQAADTLSTAGLSGITLYEPGALTIVAQAGTPLAEVEAALKAENQRLPFEPMDHRALLGTEGEPTIGGVVAANVSGPRRFQVGACRDSLIGVRYVDGQGTAIKNGGRVMKNVTGYDIVKLMAGSYGTLGVLSEVSFKVLPDTAHSSVLLFEGLSDVDAVACMCAAMATPYEVSGAAHLPVGMDGAPVTMLRLEGFEKSVAYRAGELAKALAHFGTPKVESDPDKTAAGWRYIRDVEAFAGQPGDVWRVSVKPTDGPKVAAAVGAQGVVYDWSGGLVWLLVGEGTDIRPALAGIAGHATLIRASASTRAAIPAFHPEAAPLAKVTAGLRAQFDPAGILNPGRMG